MKVVKICSKLRKFIESRKDAVLPEQEEVLADLWAFEGISEFQMERFAKAAQCFQHQYELAIKANLTEHASRSLENLGRARARLYDYQGALDAWTKRLDYEIKGIDKAWLHHEIGRAYLELNQYEEAIDHAATARDVADREADMEWDLNATVLIAQAHFYAGNLEEAKVYFEAAQNAAFRKGFFKAESVLAEAIAEVDSEIRREEAKQERVYTKHSVLFNEFSQRAVWSEEYSEELHLFPFAVVMLRCVLARQCTVHLQFRSCYNL
ncbi:unnamed protein product [Dibothriocephalus latus]|uniref:Outer dynein arm-docking complex subunit 4 n=1 Tax=Dibothriocephalus latus TaxID=60516 RepID=A0A3P6PNW9_DIBLA|nr:unnamed protein product [Dibothriocephalus latus]